MATRLKSRRSAPPEGGGAFHTPFQNKGGSMFWKLVAAVAAAIVAAQIPELRNYWGWILVIGIIVAFVVEGVRIVPQQSAWVVERLGRFHGTLEPGLNLIIPFFDKVSYIHSL